MSGIFEGKYGLITLRDLFRWAERYRRSPNKKQFFDWEQLLAEDGKRSKVKRFLKLFVIRFYVIGGKTKDISRRTSDY